MSDQLSTNPVDIRAWRHRQGWSQARLAKEIGVSEDVIRTAEDGKRPRPANAVILANFFQVDVLAQWPLEDVAA